VINTEVFLLYFKEYGCLEYYLEMVLKVTGNVHDKEGSGVFRYGLSFSGSGQKSA
jgi:hypothetical protein